METTPDPGWYPDEDDESRLRYWDGTSWTDRTRARKEAAAEKPAEPEAPPSEGGPSRRWLPIGVGGALVVIAAVVGFLVLGGGGSEEAAGSEVILQPTASAGVDPFTESVANERVNQITSNGANLAGDPVEGVTGGDATVESITGSAPGLYGGTEQETVCDPAAMVEFLEANPDKAGAFAGALGIEPDQIDKYVAALTPVLLREDTRVTNNGFASGAATPFQAVLQAGTAVLVDPNGIPRVRCACGNPLGEPAAAEGTPDFTGESWQAFDDNRLVAVSPSAERIETFELVDVETGRSFEQAAGSRGMTVDELINLPIPVECAETVPFEDGVHPESGTVSEYGATLTMGVLGAEGIGGTDSLEAVVGDVTGDGLADGVVISFSSCGGSSTFSTAYVYGPEGELLGELPNLSEDGAAFADEKSNLAIVDGGIEADVVAYAAEDPNVEPSIQRRARFEWNGSEFVEAGSASSASDSSGSSGSGGSASVPADAEDCGDGVSAGPDTSCEFALNVAEEYEASDGASTISVLSPVTGETYEMSCTSGSPHVCTGGNDASVYFP